MCVRVRWCKNCAIQTDQRTDKAFLGVGCVGAELHFPREDKPTDKSHSSGLGGQSSKPKRENYDDDDDDGRNDDDDYVDVDVDDNDDNDDTDDHDD